MDAFIAQLEQLTKASTVTSTHLKHVAVRLLRRLARGTRGKLEVRYILEDLYDSLPRLEPHEHDPFEHVRRLAKLFSKDEDIPMRPKRTAAEDEAATDEPKHNKRARGQGDVSRLGQEINIGTQAALQDAQLLYDLFLDADDFGQTSSISELLKHAVKDGADDASQKASTRVNTPSQTAVGTHEDFRALQGQFESLLPQGPKSRALRQDVSKLFENFQDENVQQQSESIETLIDILARLCAPVRDSEVTSFRNALSTAKEYISVGAPGAGEKQLQEVFRRFQDLLDNMQLDLHLFKLGVTAISADEQELRSTVREDAMKREKAVLTQLYPDHRDRTLTWLDNMGITSASSAGTYGRNEMAEGMLKALFVPKAISIRPSVKHNLEDDNQLPPCLQLAAKHLFEIQNRLQACTILATLATLVPLQSDRSEPSSSSPSWSERVWTLLMSATAGMAEGRLPEDDANGHVKIDSLADEVMRALNVSQIKGDEENRIRKSVERMLKLDDPVFKLLHARLQTGILEAVLRQEGSPPSIKGFVISPLPLEIQKIITRLDHMLKWACESWEIHL